MSGAVVHRKLRFGPFELSIGERALRRDGQVLPLGDRALDILIYLADRPGEVIAKQELIDHVWSDVTVEEGSLRVHVAAIRTRSLASAPRPISSGCDGDIVQSALAVLVRARPILQDLLI